ncbi:B3 domain-containing protein At5g42700-like isoform X2 [Salvia miltiorrhiza]|uniref:B3 domain-containing protein At5g42700-like isoform X2 n=1 Tax=Salvia miltiorrhiza TaxID=226208 RepID=UPI0025AC43DE|nr:B3 domain-containing protein At5g42700-like isoform X2 [Salvia miltiorrhiza]
MEISKLKQEANKIEAQTSDVSDYCAAGLTDSSHKKKKRRRRRNVMQLENKEKGVSKKLKSLKSKDRQASNNPKKSRSCSARKRTRYTDLYDDVEAKYSVMERAERVLAHLENELPHFVKCMLPSNVAHGFWLHLPKNFCSIHLPNHDTSIVLVDEWGNEYKTSYLLDRHGLSAGWRGFSLSHRLLKGDILIFHLTAPCKLKVHIVRVNGADVVGAALCLMNMDASERRSNGDLVKKDDRKQRKRRKTKYVEPYQLGSASPVKNVKGKNSILSPVADHSSTAFCSDVIEKGPEITNQHQTNDLCYPETSFLRDHAREGVTCR